MTTPNAPVNNNLVWGIVGLLFFWPVGIFALIKSLKVNSLAQAGDIAGAQAASESAKKLGLTSLIVGLVLCVCGVIANVVLFSSANTAGM